MPAVVNTRAGRSPTPGAVNYYIVQMFISFSEQPQTPMILRVDENATVQDVLQQGLNKYSELLMQASPTYSSSPYAPPSISSDDYILRVGKGDGTPDRLAPNLDRNGVLKDQGLLFPYMVVLTLDPAKDVSEMQLTDQFKETVLRRAAQFQKTALATNYTTSIMGAPEDPETLLETLSLMAPSPLPEKLNESSEIVQAIEGQRLKRQDLEKKRIENVEKIQRERAEKERQHLELCERKERERRMAIEQHRKEEEAKQLHAAEEHYKMELAKRQEQYIREQKQRELLEEQAARLAKEEKERQRRHEALERERLKRQQEREEARKREEAEKMQLRMIDKDRRMKDTLNYVLTSLETEIAVDNKERMEMLEQERLEREIQEKLLYEKQYLERVEKQRKMQKDSMNIERIQKEEKRRREMEEAQIRAEQEKARLQEEENKRFKDWKMKKQKETEKAIRMRELEIMEQNGDLTSPDSLHMTLFSLSTLR